MIKLYRNSINPQMWVASVPGSGWVAFPAREHGWEERRPARGLDPMFLREVPKSAAVKAGMPQNEHELEYAMA